MWNVDDCILLIMDDICMRLLSLTVKCMYKDSADMFNILLLTIFQELLRVFLKNIATASRTVKRDVWLNAYTQAGECFFVWEMRWKKL